MSVRLPVIGEESRVDALDELFAASLDGRGALHTLDDGPGSAEAGAALLRVLTELRGFRAGEPSVLFPLAALPEEVRGRLVDVLGEGEVTISVEASRRIEIRETALAGLWRVRELAEDGAVSGDFLEVADAPAVVRAADARGTCDALSIGAPPQGAMNVLPVLAELRHRMRAWAPGDANHVMSLSLLPMSDVDVRYLAERLQRGPVRARTRGHGRCEVELTGHRHIWSVQHFNAAGALILDTLEVGDVPVALTAGDEDFEDSAARLAELLGVAP